MVNLFPFRFSRPTIEFIPLPLIPLPGEGLLTTDDRMTRMERKVDVQFGIRGIRAACGLANQQGKVFW
jgi:hypothetical protein